ncbi:MAG: aminodeoxychorismate synthase component I [Gorillibacterium sp.]|nr:aminodeoxychorismate synthase component I [Gorillibacterium sp.]
MENITKSFIPIDPNSPLLHFQFPDSQAQSLTFHKPIIVVTADKVAEVREALCTVQSYVDRGYYAAGYLSYESAPAFDSAIKARSDYVMPLLWFGIFTEPIADAELVSPDGEAYEVSEWVPDTDKASYERAIAEIKQGIAKGETYQVNYTFRLRSHFHGSDLGFFRRLVKAQMAAYSAYLNLGQHRILSVSPELFFEMEQGQITARPMKGTIKRGRWPQDDQQQRDTLYHSEKDRAENVMIVDLLRNDLSKLARTGSVRVPQLYEIEKYPTVYQMTSTVQAELKEAATLEELFVALFPCGSVTGAPKINTMDMISHLEHSPREIYCGAIGYITPHKQAVFNVPIRTVWIDTEAGTAEYGVGGGVIWDSSAEGEFEEALAKTAVLKQVDTPFDLVESLRLSNGSYTLLEHHLERLRGSAEYFGFVYPLLQIESKLSEGAQTYPEGDYKARLLLSQEGKVSLHADRIEPEYADSVGQSADKGRVQQVVLSDECIDSSNNLLYHKTTLRELYTYHYAKGDGAYDVLLWNEKEQLTEFTRGNVVLELDGALWTPPLSSGLLAGTFREALLARGEIKEMILNLDDLRRAQAIWFINSVRGLVKVEF